MRKIKGKHQLWHIFFHHGTPQQLPPSNFTVPDHAPLEITWLHSRLHRPWLKVARHWGAATLCTLTRRAPLGRYRYPKMIAWKWASSYFRPKIRHLEISLYVQFGSSTRGRESNQIDEFCFSLPLPMLWHIQTLETGSNWLKKNLTSS